MATIPLRWQDISVEVMDQNFMLTKLESYPALCPPPLPICHLAHILAVHTAPPDGLT
jgi:hypothetical protein